MGLPRHRRLTRTADYDAVRQSGTVQPSRSFLLNFLADPAQPSLRYGIIASKGLGNSVIRHAAKRRFREIAREYPLPPQARGWLTIVVRSGSLKKSHTELSQEWHWAMKKLNLGSPRVSEMPKA
jgi:ribonuclease P protein component